MNNAKTCGIVVRGEQRGRRLGFPTANIALEKAHDPGIYAGKVNIGSDEQVYFGAVYVAPGSQLLEVYIFDFAKDLYGQCLCVELVEKIRDPIAFSSEEELVRQVGRDIIQVRECLRLV